MSSNLKSKRKWICGRDQQSYVNMDWRWWTTKSGKIITKTSVVILTLFAEATRMPQSCCSIFSPKLLREENKHLHYVIKQFLPMVLYYFLCVFRWWPEQDRLNLRCTSYVYKLLELSTNQIRHLYVCGLR